MWTRRSHWKVVRSTNTKFAAKFAVAEPAWKRQPGRGRFTSSNSGLFQLQLPPRADNGPPVFICLGSTPALPPSVRDDFRLALINRQSPIDNRQSQAIIP